MTTSIKLNKETHDLDFTGNTMHFIKDDAATNQRLKIKLWFGLGEWFLNTAKGIPYFKYFFIKKPNQNFIDNILLNVLASDEEVEKVLRYQTNMVDRALSVEFKVQTVYSEKKPDSVEMRI